MLHLNIRITLHNIESRRADIRHVIRPLQAAANDTSKEGPLLSLVSPARSLVARGVVDEAELKQRLARVRERLEA